MKEEILKILGKYKVIGDTTYGLGYEDAEKLANELIEQMKKILQKHGVEYVEGEGWYLGKV